MGLSTSVRTGMLTTAGRVADQTDSNPVVVVLLDERMFVRRSGYLHRVDLELYTAFD